MIHRVTETPTRTPVLSVYVAAAAGTVWAAALAMVGLWLVFSVPIHGPLGARTSTPLGVALFFGAQYVFLTLVADRLFPAAPRGLTLSAEIMVLVSAAIAAGALLTTLFIGGAH